MRKYLISGAIIALVLAQPVVNAQQPQSIEAVQKLVKEMKPQRGQVKIAEAKATLSLGKDYDFYGPADARTVLVDIWGNPPEAAQNVLGLVMKAGASPLRDNWGAVITWEPTGYVSDQDAAETDYNELLAQMKDGEAEANSQRQASGYPALHLVGWAEQPSYDKASHSIVWARNIKFSDASINTLNYDVRTLGRAGVLSINLISTMSNLSEVKTAAHEFSSHVSFDPGARYEDYDAASDSKAEYGVGGLVAAGVGVAAAKKLGLFAILLKFLKPILIGIVVLFAGFRNRIMALFGRQPAVDEE